MSGAPYLEDPKKTLEEAARQVSLDIQEADRLRTDPDKTIRERQQILHEALESAKSAYKKREYARAFYQWERACSVIEDEEFRRKVRALKESHENLVKANRELADIKQALKSRVAPPPADTKFVDGSHEKISSQVKNVYSHLSLQLRAERTPRTLSFWWPVALALAILLTGFVVLKVYHSRILRSVPAPAEAVAVDNIAPAPSPVDDAFLQAQRNSIEKEMEAQMAALKEEHEKELADARRQSAQSAQGDRERIVQLETNLKEYEARNAELQRRTQILTEDNLNKDRTIASLSS